MGSRPIIRSVKASRHVEYRCSVLETSCERPDVADLPELCRACVESRLLIERTQPPSPRSDVFASPDDRDDVRQLGRSLSWRRVPEVTSVRTSLLDGKRKLVAGVGITALLIQGAGPSAGRTRNSNVLRM